MVDIGIFLACRKVSCIRATNPMQSLLNMVVMPVFLIVCLDYEFSLHVQDTPGPALASVSPAPDIVPPADVVQLVSGLDTLRLVFGEYPCRYDCSEHLAGYQWAEENGISAADNCDGLSAEFIEGCRVYAENRTVSVAVTN